MLAAALLVVVVVCFPIADASGQQSVLQLISFDKRSLFVNKGSGFQLSCPYIGVNKDNVKIQWFKNDLPISPLPGVSVLSLKNASKFDAGSYYCKVSDDRAAVLSEATEVHVVYFTQPFVNTSFHVQAARGSYAVLNAPFIDASPSAKLEWSWSRGGELLHQSTRLFLSAGGSLLLLNVRDEDFGSYALHVRHSSLPDSLASARFNYILEPGDPSNAASGRRIVWKPKSVVFVKSDWAQSVQFECVVFDRQSAGARSHIVWKVNGRQIFDGSAAEYQFRNQRRTLVIQQPGEAQAGQYECEVAAGYGDRETATAELTVNEPPVIVHSLPNVTYATLGGSLDLLCEFQATPEARITWYFNGDDLTELLKCCAADLSMSIVPDAGLRILNVSNVHAGVYQCRARNDHGSIIDTTELRLRDRQPSLRADQNVTVLAGNNVTLSCQDVASPQPVVNWLFAGQPLKSRDDVTSTGGRLTIRNAKQKHSGSYVCIADIDSGEFQKVIHLTVETSTIFLEGPEDQAVIIGNSVKIPCSIDTPTDGGKVIRNWYLKGQPLLPGAVRNVQFMPDGSIMISHVNAVNIGPYTCEVQTGAGVFSKTGYLRIVEKPGMPLHVRASLNNDSIPVTVTLTWRQGFDGNSPILKYVLEQRVINVDGTPFEWEVAVDNVGQEQSSMDIENLKPSAAYEFRVVAVNRLGSGIPSVPSNVVVMPQQAPAAAPINVAGSARSPSAIMVQWQPPPSEQWNGDILGYVIRYRLANYPDIAWIYHNMSDPRARNWMISDLITWREYEIQMAAFNDRGAGVYSKSMYITTLQGEPTEAPTILSADVVNSTAVHIKLKPPPQQMIPGVNLGYKIEAWLGEPGGGNLTAVTTVSPHDLNLVEGTLGGLQKYVTYNVTVLCYTAPGDGPRSQPVVLTTRQDVPEEVDGAQVEDVYFDSALLKWGPPVHPNGILLNYVVSYWSLNDTSVNKTVTVPNDTMSFRLEGLKSQSAYAVRIYAVTEVGSGPQARLQLVTTVPPELPGAPSRLTVSNVQQRSVTLQFTPGYDGKTFISKWIVEALVGSSSSWQEVYSTHAPQAKMINIDTLRPYVNYTVRLVAENVVGRSPPSVQAASFQTLQDAPEHPPLEFDVQPSSSDSVRVTWNPLSRNAWNGPAGGYVLYIVADDQRLDKQHEVKIDNPKASDLPLTDLCPYCRYRISMAAFNEIGRSNRSDELLVTTYESEPSIGPVDVNVTSESPTSALISWGPVPADHRNGIITGYRVEYQSADSVDHISVDDESQRFVMCESLKPYTKYRIRVAAVNAVGVGSHSQPDVVLQTEAAPSLPPTELYFPYVTTREIRMTWKPPLVANGEIKQYAIAYWLNSTGPEGAVRVSPNFDLRLFVASGLFPMSLYTFSVAAVNSAGTGQPAVATVFTSSERGLPQSPTRPMQAPETAAGRDRISIIWHSAMTGKMPIRFSDVQMQREDGDDRWSDWQQKPADSRALVDNLLPNTAYRFRVRSVNDHGRSPWSIESDWIRTAEAEPSEPPVDITARAVDATSVLVEWQAPDRHGWHSDVVGYRILSRVYEQNQTFHVDELPMSDAFRRHWNFTLANLDRFRHYVVQLQTFNNNGSSPMSRPRFVYVGYSVLQQTVTGLRAEAISSTEVKVSWDRWVGPPVNGFKVVFGRLGQQDVQREEDVVDADCISTVLSGLNKFANYSIAVRPFNRAGDGPPLGCIVQTLADRPGPVRRLLFQDVLLDSVNVSWDSPLQPNGPIIGYRLAYRTYKLDKEFMSQRQEKVIDRQYLLVTNLEENVTVSFTVEAETVAGYGEPVNGSVVLGPQPGSPEPPGQPSLHPTASSVTLQWPYAGNASVTSYIVQYCMETLTKFRRSLLSSDAVLGCGRWQTLASLDAAQTSYTISYKQLKPDRLYRFRVAGRNDNGVSYPSQPSEQFVLPEGFQERPFYLEGWFLVILAMILLVIVVIVVASLWVTGTKSAKDKCRTDSDSSLQLSDVGIVTYQLRSPSTTAQQQPLPPLSPTKPGMPYADDHYARNLNFYTFNPRSRDSTQLRDR